MSGGEQALYAHLAGGDSTVCRCWAVTRRDGEVMGFTDHDGDLAFEGLQFRADTGLSASALQQSTGLSVDNTEALGALSAHAIREEDIEAGRYDGAEVRAWLVNWADVAARELVFRGHIGDVRRADVAFEAELRGLTDALNQPTGRVYQKTCGAVLGDRACGVDLMASEVMAEVVVERVEDRRVFRLSGLGEYAAEWFLYGQLTVLDGAAAGLSGVIKRDYDDDDQRVIELWHPVRAGVAAGDRVRVQAGCEKSMNACSAKFRNLMNFRGFPDIPNDDWSLSTPGNAVRLNGGSRRS